MRVWLSGASGFVGSNLEAVFAQHGDELACPRRDEVDVSDPVAVSRSVAGGESVTRAELARAAARAFELDESLLRFGPPEEPPGTPVPYDTSLDSTATAAALGVELPGVAEQLERLREELCVTT